LLVGDNASGSASSSSGALPTTEGYKYTETFFMITAGAGLFVAAILFLVDKRGAGVLGASPARRAQIKADMQPIVGADVN
jgi:hypothetical protein